jgi:hypothetical protein
VLQLPLYTAWTTGTRKQQAFAVVHCTVGDAMIAGLPLLVALALFARTPWPSGSAARVYAASLAFGVGYTIYEWLNTGVRRSWAYSGLMPVVPVIGTGLAPLMQWLERARSGSQLVELPGSINVSARVEQRERENATCHRSKASWDRR